MTATPADQNALVEACQVGELATIVAEWRPCKPTYLAWFRRVQLPCRCKRLLINTCTSAMLRYSNRKTIFKNIRLLLVTAYLVITTVIHQGSVLASELDLERMTFKPTY